MRRLLALSLLLASTTAFGQWNTGPYVGLGIGHLDYDDEWFRIEVGDTTEIYRIYGGYRFDGAFAIEGYHSPSANLASVGTGTLSPIGDYAARIVGDFDISEIRGLAYLGSFMVGLGYFDTGLKITLYGTSDLVESFSRYERDSDQGLSYIVGGEWSFDDWTLRAEYEYLDTESPVDAYTLGVSAHYTF